MKRTEVIAAFLTLLSGAFLFTASSDTGRVRELAPGVYYRPAEPEKRIIANAGWVVFRDYVLVIDANFPWGAKAVLEDLRKTTKKPVKFVFDTHYHGDHANGNSVWVDAGATILCSEECQAELQTKGAAAWANSRDEGQFSLKPYRLETAQIAFRGRLVFDDGEHRVELIRLGPGHTKGDAVAWLPKERILFTGDLCVNSPGNNLADADADPDNWLRALDSLRQYGVARVVPGHGGEGDARTLDGQRAYLADMIQGIRDGTAQGKSADDLARGLDLSSHKPWGENAERNQVSIRAVYARLQQLKGGTQ